MRSFFTRRGTVSLLAAGALVAGLLTSPIGAPQAAAQPGDPLQWGPCPKSAGFAPKDGAECALFQAPMDYKKPDGKKNHTHDVANQSDGAVQGRYFCEPRWTRWARPQYVGWSR